MSIKGQGHSLTLVKGHSDLKVKCLTFGLYTQVSDSGPLGPLVFILSWCALFSRLICENPYSTFDFKRCTGTISSNFDIYFTWNDRIFIPIILWCISIQNSLILLDIVICKGNYFQRKRKWGRSLFYIVCRKTDSQWDSPYRQKNIGRLSRICRLVLSRTLRIITMNKSLNISFIYIKKG